MEWFKNFITQHGERLVFMGLATLFGAGFFYINMAAEGKTLLIAVGTLCLNKARSPQGKKD